MVDVSQKRQEKDLHDKMILVLKSAQTAKTSQLEDTLTATCVPTAVNGEEELGVGLERLAGHFAECADNHAPHGTWGGTRESLQVTALTLTGLSRAIRLMALSGTMQELLTAA